MKQNRDERNNVHSVISKCLGFPHSSVGKQSACNAGDPRSIPGLGRSPGEGKGYPSHSGLENPMDCMGHRVARSWTRLSNFYFTSLLYPDTMLGETKMKGPSFVHMLILDGLKVVNY